VHLERTRAANDVQERDQIVEDNCLLALDIVLGYASDISLRWDARETARLLLPRCLTEAQLHDAIVPALARSDMLPARRNAVPVEDIQANLDPVLSQLLREFELAPQPASFVRVPKDRFVTRPAALLAPMWLLDNCDLEVCATTAAELGQWDFHLAVAPVRFAGTSGSPVNPIATF
jgi:hypothetical protein